MRAGRLIKVMGLIGVTLALGALGSWWFLRTAERGVQGLQATSDPRQAETRDSERVKAQLRTENQRLREGNAVLQANLAALSARVAAMEETELTLKAVPRETDIVDLKGRVAALESSKRSLEAGVRNTEQLRAENQQLSQDSVALQTSIVALKKRIADLESTKTSLEHSVERIKKQLETSHAKQDKRQRVAAKNRPGQSTVVPQRRNNKPAQERPKAEAAAQRQVTLRALADDELALLLVQFLAKHDSGWFNAPTIQSMGEQQKEFSLFQYHSWATMHTTLRRLEGAGVVRGRRDDNPRVDRQFAIKQGTPLRTLQTLASHS